MLTTGMVLKKEPKDFICQCIKAMSGETGHAHIKEVSFTGDDTANTKCLLDTLEGQCKPRSNEIVTATAYKQLLQGDLWLLYYIENAKKSQLYATSTQYMTNA